MSYHSFSERIDALNIYEEISVMSRRMKSKHCHLQNTYSIVFSKNHKTLELSKYLLYRTFHIKSAKYTINIYIFYFLLNIFTMIIFCVLIQKNVNERSRWWLSSALSSFLNFNYFLHLDSVILSENDRWYSYLSFSESITESTHYKSLKWV